MSGIHSTLFRICQLAAAFCFIGHGAFGLITKQEWCPFFAVVGISESAAFQLMPWVGAMDISLGVLLLLRPMPLPLLFMGVWAIWTAMCRPLAGLGWWEFLERAGNYGPPFALLLLSGWSWERGSLLMRLEPGNAHRLPSVIALLRLATALLLIGHGGFGAFMEKKVLLQHWRSIGISLQASDLLMLGCFEIGLGLAALGWSSPRLFFGIFLWKIGTELLHPLSGTPVWEFIERAGSYAAPLALALYYRHRAPQKLAVIPSPQEAPACEAPLS